MELTIAVVAGESAGTRTTLRATEVAPILLGRGEECEFPLWDEVASRRHALLECRPDGLWLVDLGSANGTWIGEDRIDRRLLTGGELVRIGTTVLRIETESFRRRSTEVLKPEEGRDRLQVLRRVAWDNVDLGAEVSSDADRAQRLNSLLDHVRDILAAEGGAAILPRFLERGCDLIGATGACAVPCAARTGEPLWRETVAAPRPLRSPRPSRTLVERVRAEREAVVVADPQSDPRAKNRESIVSQGASSWIAVPLLAHDRLHAIAIFTTEAGAPPFGAEELALAATLGQVTALALAAAERLETSHRLLAVGGAARSTELITEDPILRDRIAELEKFAAAGGPLLIVGETGTGKELLAHRAHRNGPNPEGPFIVVNCAALPPGLLESELFGHEEGAFTGATSRRPGMFELADGGTIFLDEIGELPLDLQPKLLRVLESGEFYRIGGAQPVKVRVLVLSATHRDLEARVEDGTFREDLLYRLGRFCVSAPPLRERPNDLEPLVRRFLEAACRAQGATVPRLSKEAGALLRIYRWPGNVRELRNVIERAAVLARAGVIHPEHLGLPAPSGAGDHSGGPGTTPSLDSGDPPRRKPQSLREAEEAAVRAAMLHTEGHRGDAARLLGVSEPTLRRKLRAFGLDGDSAPPRA